MPLKIALKPNEKIIVGGSVIENVNPRKMNIMIHNDATILRENDILKFEDANTPIKRLYYTIQEMYLLGEIEKSVPLHDTFHTMTRDVLNACPSQTHLILEISEYVFQNKFYKALKLCKNLIEYETMLLEHAKTS